MKSITIYFTNQIFTNVAAKSKKQSTTFLAKLYQNSGWTNGGQDEKTWL